MSTIGRTAKQFNYPALAAFLGLILSPLLPFASVRADDWLVDVPPATALRAPPPGIQIIVDHSGQREKGIASIYSHSFDGRLMANGRPYQPTSHVAASRSLPLGTVARVTNLQNGKSTQVTIEDRGPFISGRVVDLTPLAANEIGLTEDAGLAPVIVSPLSVPQPDGSIKPGAGAQEAASARPNATELVSNATLARFDEE